MSNTIRIRRRASGDPGAPSSLDNAELAFNEVDNTLYYGKGTGGAGGTATTVEAIAGVGAFVDKTTSQTISGAKTFSSGITADVTGTVSDISNHTTDDLAEGTTNLYYADSLVDAHLTGGTGVTYSNGTISIAQDVSTTADVTFNSMVLDGDLTVNGTVTTVNTETVELADNIVELNSNFTGDAPTESAGFTVNRDLAGDKSFLWDETNDKWTVGTDTLVAGTFEGDLTGNASSADQLSTARTISLGGDLGGSTSFDGSANVTISASVVNDSHSHTLSTITDAGTMAAQNANNVDINGGTIDGVTLDGGTF